MKDPLVSVKTLTYNHAPYIAQAIEGVLQQKTNFPFELVIGEDCSTDGTREIVFEYQKKYPDIIRVITSEQNVGARMNGYRTEKACRGKYVAYCEGDDYWHCPDKLQKQVDYMESHPECALVHSDCDYYEAATGRKIHFFHRTKKMYQPDNPDINTVLFDRTCHVFTCTAFVRRDLLYKVIDSDPILYQSGRFLMGDTPRWAEISRLGKIAFIDESLATCNRLLESISRSRDIRKTRRFSKSACEMVLYLIDKHGLPINERRKYENRWRKTSLNLAFCERDAELAKQVKKESNEFTITNYLLFWGAQSKFINYSLTPLVYLWRYNRRLLRWFYGD